MPKECKQCAAAPVFSPPENSHAADLWSYKAFLQAFAPKGHDMSNVLFQMQNAVLKCGLALEFAIGLWFSPEIFVASFSS